MPLAARAWSTALVIPVRFCSLRLNGVAVNTLANCGGRNVSVLITSG